MKIDIRQSFVKEAKKVPAHIQRKVADIIEEIEAAKTLGEIGNCKKLTGYKTAYRIKLESYRIGFFYSRGLVELTTLLHRKEIYRYFP